jgi:hypothetical protein
MPGSGRWLIGSELPPVIGERTGLGSRYACEVLLDLARRHLIVAR